MNEKYVDIENKDEKILEIINQTEWICDKLIELGIQYINKISGFNPNNDFIDLRDNLIYRIRCSRFHSQLLLNHEDIMLAHLEHLKNNTNTELRLPAISQTILKEQYSIFDSFLYHLCSAFDYLAVMLWHIRYKNKENKTWNKLINKIRSEGDEILKETLLLENSDFVDKLFEHRSKIIHYSNDVGNSSISQNISESENNIKIKIWASKKIIKHFHELRKNYADSNVTLHFTAFWLFERTLKSFTNILRSTNQYIESNRIISKEDEPIKINKK